MSATDRFEFVVLSEPIPNARARRGGHGFYTPKRTLEYRTRIQMAWMMAGRPSLGAAPFVLSVMFYRSTAQPCDLDNLIKGVLDALNALSWADDERLTCISGAHKLRCAPGDERTELAAWIATSSVGGMSARTVSDNWRTITAGASAGEHWFEARPSAKWEKARSDAVRADEDAAAVSAREKFTTGLDRLEHELNALYKHGREHRLMTHRQYASIRRALIGARSGYPGRLTD